MPRSKKKGKKNNSQSRNEHEEASTKSQDPSKGKLPDVAEKQEGNKDKGKSDSVFPPEMQSVKEFAPNDTGETTSMEDDNRAAGKSKKKRSRGVKSTPDISSSEMFPCTKHEDDPSNRASVKDTDMRYGRDNPAFKWGEQITQRISQLESNLTGESNFNKLMKHMTAANKSNSYSEEGKIDVTSSEEKKNPNFPSDETYKTCGDFRRVIFTTNKAIQIYPEPPPDDKNSATLNPDSDVSVATKPRESPLLLPSPLSIPTAKSIDEKNAATLNADSDGSVATEPIAPILPVEGTNPETVSEHTDTSQNKISSDSSLTSHEENLQSIADEFLENLKITIDKFENEFMKILKSDK